ncbi:class I SAM-dependent methyltransferase [Zavarzinia sp. CC-PAN008]|uniref:class I SAM-dependent methyltransferase n=1 Tax=Zavarzinia sp. CC-PAN008 TaxID=3243332 RepID=UPI003F746A7C
MREPSLFLMWLKQPFHIGAVAPSSPALSRRMAAQVLGATGTIVELGGGTGPITRALLEAGIAPERLVVVERDPTLFETLRRNFPTARVLLGDAAHLDRLLADQGIPQVGGIVSGLPLLNMSAEIQEAILRAGFAALAPGGCFVQFTYGPAVPVRRTVLQSLALRARRAGRAWLNLPPATVWCFERAAA